MASAHQSTLSNDEVSVLTEAVLKAASLLNVKNNELADILGVSQAAVSKATRGGNRLPQTPKTHELAILFVRLYRSLDSITGGDDTVSASWLRNENTALSGRPIDMIKTIPGLVETLTYLDDRRARI